MQIGRLMVQVPDVTNILPSSWAHAVPAVRRASSPGSTRCPTIGSSVWVEFEQGNPDYPIWTGCFWGPPAEVPALALAAPPGLQQIVVQTAGQNTLLISDVPGPTGGILLKSSTGALISISDTGITSATARARRSSMTGPAVTINEGALEVI